MADIPFTQLQKDVRNVVALNESGKDMAQIAKELDLSLDYVLTILTCAQGFMEDDVDAVVHLVEMSL